MLSSAGIPVVTAAELAVNHTDNAIVSKLVENVPKNARNGRPMYTGLNSQLIPTALRYMWETGEESGTLDDTTARLAKMYEELAEEKFRQFVFWLPKILYGAVGIYIIYLIARNAGYVYGI
jgi:type II secretory pathway component PulF